MEDNIKIDLIISAAWNDVTGLVGLRKETTGGGLL
jgi:hypothetical protein